MNYYAHVKTPKTISPIFINVFPLIYVILPNANDGIGSPILMGGRYDLAPEIHTLETGSTVTKVTLILTWPSYNGTDLVSSSL